MNTTPTKIILRNPNNPRRGTHWRRIRSANHEPLYARRGELFHTQTQLEALAKRIGYVVVCKYNE